MLSRLAFCSSLIIAAFAVGMAWHFWRTTRALALAYTDTRGEVVRLTKRLDELPQTRAREDQAKTGSGAEKTAVKETVVPKTWYEISEADFKKQTEEHRGKLLSTPNLQVLYEQHIRAWHGGVLAALFRQLKLSPEEKERLIAALVKGSMQQQDLEAVAKAKGVSRNDPEWAAQRAAVNAEQVREIEAVLGPGALAMIREYTRLDAARSYVAGYAGLFSRLGEPLTFDQVEALTATFGRVSPKQTPVPSQLTPAQWEQVWVEAEKILTPGQWSEFQTIAPPGEAASRWESVAQEALTKAAGPLQKN